jgi:hypothetical protein
MQEKTMPERPIWSFMSVFDSIIPTLHLTECEIYIIWTLGEEGARSIYGIAKKARDLPETSATLSPGSWKRPEKGLRYDYHFVHSKVKELRKKGLVQIQSSNNQEPKAGLTFLGLMFYLQNLRDAQKGPFEKLKHALKNYRTLIPLFADWELMTKHLGTEKCSKAFDGTVTDFILHKARFQVRPIHLTFEGFLKRCDPICMHAYKALTPEYERVEKASEYLKSKENLVLRSSYIAYLAVHNIWQLSGQNFRDIESHDSLESETELAYFENRQINSNPLFKGDRLLEFFPEYASIEYFFTGMFVENLLWNKKPIKETKEAKTPDFEVEFY